MHVVVLGAGEVGVHVCDRLSREGHDVALVDRDATRIAEAEDRLDVQTVVGRGTSPSVLEQAGIGRADLFVAVSNDDEANLVAALIAKQADVDSTIVRLQSDALRGAESSRLRKAMGVDHVIDPDLETAQEIYELLRVPGASEIFPMVGGEIMLIGARLPAEAPMAGQTLLELAHAYEPHWDFLIGSITRGGKTSIARQDMRLEPDDHLRMICNLRGRKQLMSLLNLETRTPRRVMLLGGGHTARTLAQRLQDAGAFITIVERKAARARELAERLEHCVVLEGEITDPDLLTEEEIGRQDVVIALTGEDDANILACLFAKAAGATETIAVVHRLALLPLVHEAGIDVAISPRTAIANAVLRVVRGGDISSITTFLEGEAEIFELLVKEGSVADGAVVSELPLPKDVLVGAVVRDGNAEIARGRTKLHERDRVIAFAMPQASSVLRRIFG
ncbi:MAG: Trk system potassium transporter TrkA [Actinomycetota bacterium]